MSGFAATIQQAFEYDPLLLLRILVTLFCFYVLYETYVYVTGRGKQYLGILNLLERLTDALLAGVGRALVVARALPADEVERMQRRPPTDRNDRP